MKIPNNIKCSGVYKISHPDTSKIYIGSAENMKKRSRAHCNMIMTDTHHSRAMRRFSKNVDKSLFEFEVIEYVSNIDNLEKREQYYLDTLLKANENNADFFRLGLNGNRRAERNGKAQKFEKAVLQYSLSGNFIREWRSAKIASTQLKISYTNIIQALIEESKYRSAGGYQWKPYTENFPIKIKKFEKSNVVKVQVYSTDGKFINEFSSIRQASIFTNVAPASISSACKTDIVCRGYRFRKYKNNFPKSIGSYKYYLSKNIYVYSKIDTEFIGVFDSITHVSKTIKVSWITISNNLDKSNPKSYCKYIFRTKPLNKRRDE